MLESARRFGVVMGGAAVLALAAGALGQSDGKKKDAPKEEPKPLLSGPAVDTETPPGVVEGFGGADGRMMARERLPARALERILRGMLAEDAPEEVRLSAEQRERVREMQRGLEEARRAYMREHAEEIRELRRIGNVEETDRPVDRRRPDRDRPRRDAPRDEMSGPEGMDSMDGPAADARQQERARGRLREIMSASPGVEGLYAQVWEILTEPQRAHVEGEIERFREEMAKQREEQYVERQMRERRAAGETDRRPEGAPERGRRPLASAEQRRARLVEIFNSLSPEEQVQLIDRLERSMAERRRDRAREDGAKPAPGVDGVKVPEAEGGEEEKPRRRPRD